MVAKRLPHHVRVAAPLDHQSCDAPDLAVWLRGLGLERYLDVFRDNDIDRRILPLLTDADLQSLGVSLGHRRLLLAAVARGAAPAAAEQAERRLVSVLFCDMVNSTELARRIDPEDLRHLLRSYQDRVAAAIARYGGHLAQYLGDGVMAFFGWPTAYEDQAERAVRAGLEAIANLRGLEDGVLGPIRGRVAIATGEVVVGDLSSSGRQEGAVAGETPNFAARLQQCAEPDQLVICGETRRLVGAAFEVRDGGERALKGFDRPVRFHRVEAVRESGSRFDLLRGQSLSRFVGRDAEQALVLEKWRLAKGGAGQVVLISGEAGIGKSRFVRAIADMLGDDPHSTWQIQCSPYHMNSALFPVIQSLARALAFRPDDGPTERHAKLAEYLGDDPAGDRATTLPLLSELLSIGAADEVALRGLAPQERKTLALNALVERFVALAGGAPLLLVLEDAHWIDPTTLELLERLVTRLATARILLLVQHRPEWSTDWSSRHGHVTTFTLGRLSRPQIADLVRDVIGPDVAGELIGEIADRTDGVPMFVEEVARALAESGRADGPDSLLVPATLQGALVARLDALDATARAVVQAASVMGREFVPEVIARVCGLRPPALEAALDELVRARLVVRGAGEIVFLRHALIQDVAYQSLLRSRRRQLHETVADALIDIRPRVAETQPEILAHHLTEASLFERALIQWQRAGTRALARYANDEAVRHLERGHEVARRVPPPARDQAVLQALLHLGRAQRAASQLPLAMATFERAAALARDLGDDGGIVEAVLGYEQAQFSTSESGAGSYQMLLQALARVGESPDSVERCRLLTALTRVHIMAGDNAAADDCGRRAAAMARRLGDAGALTEALIHAMLVPLADYSPEKRVEFAAPLDELLTTAERVDDHDTTGRAYAACFYRWTEAGDRDRMDTIRARWSAWAEARNNTLIQWINRHVAAMYATMDGDLAAAERLAEQAVAMGRDSQRDQAEGVYGLQMFTIRREQARLAEVAPVIKELVADARLRAVWEPGFALVACELGYHDAARGLLSQLAADGFALPRDAKFTTSLAYLAEICATVAETGIAETLYQLLEPYAHMTITAGVATMCHGSAQRHLGLLAGTLGDLDRAERHFEQALHLNERLRAPLWVAHTQADFANLLRRRGRPVDRARADELDGAAWTAADGRGLAALTRKLRSSKN